MRRTAVITALAFGTTLKAQAPHWLEDKLYGGGKMNAVVAVVGVIVIGIGLWMWMQDRRLKRMEDRLNEQDRAKP